MPAKAFAAVSFALFASSSLAAPPGSFYAGLNAGRTSVEGFPERKASYGGFVAWQYTSGIAIEASARRLGAWDFDGDVRLTQAGVAMVASMPVMGSLDLYGRFGYNHIEIDNGSHRVTVRKRGIDGGNVGLGLAYHVTPAIAARIEFQKAASDVGNTSVSLLVYF